MVPNMANFFNLLTICIVLGRPKNKNVNEPIMPYSFFADAKMEYTQLQWPFWTQKLQNDLTSLMEGIM